MTEQLAAVDAIIDRYPQEPASLIMVLQDLQAELNHVPDLAVDRVSDRLGVPRARIHSTVSFYKAFSTEPRGKHRIDVCMGTACHVRGAGRLVDQLSEELGVKPGGTTDDLEVSLDTVHCVGACALGPVVVMDGAFHGEMKPQKLSRTVKACLASDPEAGAAAPVAFRDYAHCARPRRPGRLARAPRRRGPTPVWPPSPSAPAAAAAPWAPMRWPRPSKRSSPRRAFRTGSACNATAATASASKGWSASCGRGA